MSTVAELDAEIAAKIISDTQQTQRMISDYLPGSGEQVPPGEFRFRLKVDVQNRPDQSSNRSGFICVAEIIWMVMMEVSGNDVDESVYQPGAWIDQQTLVDQSNDGFWNSMAAVKTIVAASLPSVIVGLERVGQVLKFSVTVQLELQP